MTTDPGDRALATGLSQVTPGSYEREASSAPPPDLGGIDSMGTDVFRAFLEETDLDGIRPEALSETGEHAMHGFGESSEASNSGEASDPGSGGHALPASLLITRMSQIDGEPVSGEPPPDSEFASETEAISYTNPTVEAARGAPPLSHEAEPTGPVAMPDARAPLNSEDETIDLLKLGSDELGADWGRAVERTDPSQYVPPPPRQKMSSSRAPASDVADHTLETPVVRAARTNLGIGSPVGPVTLSELERSLSGEDEQEVSPFAEDFFGDDAFGALEQAFDEVAKKPEPRPFVDDTAKHLTLASVDSQTNEVHINSADAPRPPRAPAPPPLKLRRIDSVPHLSLSAEAIELAALPIRPEEVSGPHGFSAKPPKRPTLEPRKAPDAAPAPAPAPAATTGPEPKGPTARPRAEGTASLVDEVPPTFSGFSALRVILAFVVFLGIGGGVGVLIAPDETPKAATSRTRAERQFADGNRWYDQGRFDDALGAYRGAIAVDRTFAPAHRGAGAALAKQERYAEAAEAYATYLEVAPDAVDSDQVKAILARYRGQGDGS